VVTHVHVALLENHPVFQLDPSLPKRKRQHQPKEKEEITMKKPPQQPQEPTNFNRKIPSVNKRINPSNGLVH